MSAQGGHQPVGVLGRIIDTTREELERRKLAVPVGQLEERATERLRADNFRSFAAALARPGLSVIAEHKRRSPSAGVIREDLGLEDVVSAYERGGAAALSVLTEGRSFGGVLEDVTRARAASSLPILRKEFIVDPYQITEAVAAGADAVLLIVAALGEGELSRLFVEASSQRLATLVEVHDAHELEIAAELGAPIIGINNRDLVSLTVDPGTTYRLLPHVPAHATVVAESGFRTRRELDELGAAGLDAVLIGEALMRSTDIERACRRLTAPE